MNSVQLIGRLTRDVELRYTASGIPVGNFSLAIDRPFANQQGERETDFINCVIWRKSAENLANMSRKGSLIGVEGSIQTRNYENQQGQRVYVTEVLVDRFHLLEPKSVTESRPRSSDGTQSGPSYTQSSYSNTNYNQNQGQQQYSGQTNANQYQSPSQPQQPAQTEGFQQGNVNQSFNYQADNTNSATPFVEGGESVDIAEDDLPF